METEHWIQYFTQNSKDNKEVPYYYCKDTKITQWEKPEEMVYYYYGRKESNAYMYRISIGMASPTLDIEMPTETTLLHCFQTIGVDDIANLKQNSIRELHRLHELSLHTLEWKDIARMNNGLLLYVIASQFFNPCVCYEEFVACCQELCLFSELSITVPILLDTRLGGVNKINNCFYYAISHFITDSLQCDESIFSLYEIIVKYLPYSNLLLDIFQRYFQVNTESAVLRCIIRLSQNHVDSFIKSIQSIDSMSSCFITLLNETDFYDAFASLLWQFLYSCLCLKPTFLYASDEMVLIDILIRALKNEPESCPLRRIFKKILKQIKNTPRWNNEMGRFKENEIQSVLF